MTQTQAPTQVTVQLNNELVNRIIEAAKKVDYPIATITKVLTKLINECCENELRKELESKLMLLELIAEPEDDSFMYELEHEYDTPGEYL
jgi:hypothetical protein